MKHLIIGDLHGRNSWEKAPIEQADQVIFLGDYTDSLTRPKLTAMFRDNRALFQIAYQHNRHLFTHAGVTYTWFRRFWDAPVTRRLRTGKERLADLINQVELTNERDLLYAPSRYRTGENSDAEPLWADYIELSTDPAPHYHQYVGHSPMESRYTETIGGGYKLTFLDVLHNKKPYFHQINL